MQEYLHASHDEVLQAVERFEKMISTDKVVYFDVHQVENIYDFYFDKSLYKQAEQILELGIQQHPQSSALFVKKAMLHAEQGQNDEALQVLEKVAPIENTNSDVFMTIGWIMLQKNEKISAIKNFKKACDLAFEDEEDTLLEIGYNLNQYDIYDEAIFFLQRLLDKNPQNENALFELAFALDKVFEYEKSITTYEKLLSINPFSENGWYNLGIIYNKIEKYLEASKAYEYAIAINPNHGEAHFNKGNSLMHHGFYKEALDSYIEHVSLSSDPVLSYQYIADCWEQLGDYNKAIRFYQLVIKEVPSNSDAWYGMGIALMEVANFTEGIKAIDQAISINPINADYWFAHARGLFELEKVEDAARSLENGLNIDPEELTGWFELLKLKIALNANFNIDEYISTLIKRYNDCAAVHYLSTVAHFHYLNDKQAALKSFQQAIEINKEGLQNIEEDYPEILIDKDILELMSAHIR